MEEYQVEKVYQLDTLSCSGCVPKIEGMLRHTKGVNAGRVTLEDSEVRVVFDKTMSSADEIKSKIEKLGFKILSEK